MKNPPSLPLPSLLLLPALLAPLALGGACKQTLPTPDLGNLYSRAATYHGLERHPVVLIPGILGSTLHQRETERVVWGAFGGDAADPGDAADARLISLPMELGVPLAQLSDDVYASGALDKLRIRLFGLPFQAEAYFRILGALGVGGYRDQLIGMSGAIDYGDDHFTCFQFPYDWRRDISEAAAELDAFLEEQEEYVRTEYGTRYAHSGEPVRFDVVAHSMGGMVLRYYLRYGAAPLPEDGSLPELTWAGAARVRRAVLVGTPNAGSIKVFGELLHGADYTVQKYAPSILSTMPALYQLMPRVRHDAYVSSDDPGERVDPFDVALWARHGWGLADPKEDKVLRALLPDLATPEARREVALDHLDKCLRRAEQLHRALDLAAEPPPGLELFLAVGDAHETAQGVAIDPRSGSYEIIRYAPGDGTVVRTSALLDERVGSEWRPHVISPIAWDRVQFFFDDHLGLTKDPAFIDNLLFWLLEEPPS